MTRWVLPALAVLGCAEARDEPPEAADLSEAPVVERQEPDPEPVVEVVRQAVPPLGERYDFERRASREDLPGRLDEVSGLAFTSDGRLFAHNDERGRVHEIDPVSGEVGKRFDLAPEVRADFEGIAIAGDRFFLIDSRGRLFEFREGDDRSDVPYRRTDTGVGDGCEVEGLEHEPSTNRLLLACKTVSPDRGAIEVFGFDLETGAGPERVSIDRAALRDHDVSTTFEPSGLAVSPAGTWVLVSARQERLIEVDPERGVLSVVSLSNNRHPQPEGIAFSPEGTLFIADERNGRDARLTTYARQGGSPGR